MCERIGQIDTIQHYQSYLILAAPSGTKTYILRSVLELELVQIATARDQDILAIEQADREALDLPADDDETVGSLSNGSIIAWNNSDQLGSIGILYVILALILVEGRAINDSAWCCLSP